MDFLFSSLHAHSGQTNNNKCASFVKVVHSALYIVLCVTGQFPVCLPVCMHCRLLSVWMRKQDKRGRGEGSYIGRIGWVEMREGEGIRKRWGRCDEGTEWKDIT